MATSFSSLPIIDLHDLKLSGHISPSVSARLSEQLYDVFVTTGFAYLTNVPLSFDDEAVFDMACQFFKIPMPEKMRLAKKTFQAENRNTYRGYFPTQPLSASDNLKEGFEIGPTSGVKRPDHGSVPRGEKIDLSEPNVWPDENTFGGRDELEQLYHELQSLSSQLLSLLAVSLGKDPTFFSAYLQDSISTLRLLHYPPLNPDLKEAFDSQDSLGAPNSLRSTGSRDSSILRGDNTVKLSCTPHTDSGILTLLHQDSTGGLEVRNSLGEWVAAPYVPGSIIVNIGDLMAEVSGGRFVATMHRVRAPLHENKSLPSKGKGQEVQFGRFSVPFFFEPGETCTVRSIDDDGTGPGLLYGEHVRNKMKTWVEFQNAEDTDTDNEYSL